MPPHIVQCAACSRDLMPRCSCQGIDRRERGVGVTSKVVTTSAANKDANALSFELVDGPGRGTPSRSLALGALFVMYHL